jgi:transposase
MAYFLGCDVSKRKLDVCLIDENGRPLWAEQVVNDEVALAEFLLALSGNYAELTCVVEATACYHLPLAETAYVVGIPCLVYNPILTKQQIRATVRGSKTDRTDAIMIARLGLRGEGKLFLPEQYPLTKSYARGQQKLSQFAVALTTYQAHLEDLLGRQLSPEAVRALEEVRVAFGKAKVQFGREVADSLPPDLSARLQTIPGVGSYTAASVIGEIQDMKRFRTSKQLVAFAGLDPRIKQSGHTLNTTGRLTKRGSSYLRRSLFIAASVARQHDPIFQALYEKKRAEGKPYTVAVCVVARKLLVTIRAVWLTGEKYNCELI